jgi:hypothetical protein
MEERTLLLQRSVPNARHGSPRDADAQCAPRAALNWVNCRRLVNGIKFNEKER